MPRKKPEANGDAVVEPVPVDDPAPESFDEPTRPVQTIRYGWVKCCIWRNETDQGVRFNTTFARLYRIGEDQWSQSASFGYRDLPFLEKCAAAALEFIRAQYDDTPF